MTRRAAPSLLLRVWLTALAVFGALLVPTEAAAHTIGLSRSEWRVEGRLVSVEIALARADALALLPRADADADGELSESEARADGVATELAALRVQLRSGGADCELRHARLELVEEDGARVVLTADCGAAELLADLSGFFEALPAGHRQAAFVVDASGAERDALLHAGSPRLVLGAASASAPSGGWLDVAREYLVLGVEHIWFGIDHVIFLLGLVLVRATVRDVVAMATAFTVAHSLTLALAVLDVVVPSGAVIEPLIALSVAYVGVENLRGVEPRTRWRLTAVFGLVHGFGFAGALAEVGLPSDRIPLALSSFNLGVELGQLAILLVVVPVLARLHERPWFRERAVRVLSGAIVVVGLAWFVERVFL